MEFRILGLIDVRNEAGTVELGGRKPRAVLAVLLLHANEPVSAERLALALWGEDAPGRAVKTVQVYVSRLRKALGDPDIVATTAAGYRLRVRPGELDAERFERLVEEGRAALAGGHPETASTLLREALSLWRGSPLADLADEPFAAAETARLDEQRLAALEARVEADLAAGRHDALVGELQQLVADNPTRERLAGQLMLALYRCGRQSESLEAYHRTRRVLVSEIGVEPGPELRSLQDAILRQDASLRPQAVTDELPPELDAAALPLAGRVRERAWIGEHWARAREGRGALVAIVGPRGIGKSRLAAEVAGECHRGGATVLYVTGTGSTEAALHTLGRVRGADEPTLVAVDDADRGDAKVLSALEELTPALAALPVLVLATGEDVDALAGLGAGNALALGPLDAEAVASIALEYAPGKDREQVPTDWLLEASAGVPRRVREAAGQWARREAAGRVEVVAGRAAAGREELRSIEAELTGGLVDLQAAGERAAGRGDDEVTVVCPFKGLASFDVADAPYFYGRDRLVAQLVAGLVGTPLLGVVGPSGGGKSSIMRAGLLPGLTSGVLPGSEHWAQVLIRPGQHPLRELNSAMAGGGDQPVVVAVDQFEETFTACEDEEERRAFVDALVAAARDRDARCTVVLALRADFYGRCAAYPALSAMLAANHVLVGPMRNEELRDAIEGPARRSGLRVDSELTDALMRDVEGEPGALPLLSTALLELWQRRDGRRLAHAAYERTGGVHGAVSRLAEEAFGQLGEEQQRVARGVLMRLVGEGAAGGIERRRVPLAELETLRSEDVARVVALLTDRRLLTVSTGTVELAHEALVREWPRLRGWIEDDRDGLRIQRNLNAAAQEWKRLKQDEGALYRGSRFSEVLEWRAAGDRTLNDLEREFISASDAGRQRDRDTRRRRLVLAFSGLMTVLVAISIVAIVSVSQSREAQRQRDIAASRDLAGRAAGLLDSDPGLSRLIALRGHERQDTEQAESAVRQATFNDRAIAILPAKAHLVYAATPSRDGRKVATAGDDGSVQIWDLQGRRVASTITGHRKAAKAVDFSPDGTKVASAGEDGEVAVAGSDGKKRSVLLRIPPGPGARPTSPDSVEFSSDASRLVVGAKDGTVRLVNLRDRASRVLGRHAAGVRMARFNPVATKVVSAGDQGLAWIWDVGSGRSLPLVHPDTVVVFGVSFSPDGRRVATASSDGVLRIWDATSGDLAMRVKVVAQDLVSVRYSPDGSQLVTGAVDGLVRVYSARQAVLLTELKGAIGVVSDAAFAAGGAIVSTGEEGALRIWAPGKTTALRGAATRPSFSVDGRHVVWGNVLGQVRRWDLTTGRDRRLPGHADATVARESADGSRIVSAAEDGTARLYDVESGRSRSVPAGPTPEYAVAIDRTGRRFAVAGAGGRIRIQGDDGSGPRVLPGQEDDVVGLAFSPDTKHLASASTDGTARIFNVATGKRERTLRGHADTVTSVAYSADGKRIVTAGADATIRIWTVTGGASNALVLYGHRGAVNTAVFNRRGDRIVSAGEDGTVRVWNAAGGGSLVVLHRYEVANGADFSPDGKRVVSAGGEGVSNRGVLRVSACEVCGPFPDVLRVARSRADRKLSSSDRQRLLAGGP